jgi:hypothetical protein
MKILAPLDVALVVDEVRREWHWPLRDVVWRWAEISAAAAARDPAIEAFLVDSGGRNAVLACLLASASRLDSTDEPAWPRIHFQPRDSSAQRDAVAALSWPVTW